MFVVLLATLFALGAIVYRTTMTRRAGIDPLAGRPGTTATTSTTVPGDPRDLAARGPRPLPVRRHRRPSSGRHPPRRRSRLPRGPISGPPTCWTKTWTTAWNEGVEGPGVGEWVRFDFGEPVVLTRIEIANGYQKDEERFQGTHPGPLAQAGVFQRLHAVDRPARHHGYAGRDREIAAHGVAQADHHRRLSRLRVGRRGVVEVRMFELAGQR